MNHDKTSRWARWRQTLRRVNDEASGNALMVLVGLLVLVLLLLSYLVFALRRAVF